jgi:hypothetical protein
MSIPHKIDKFRAKAGKDKDKFVSPPKIHGREVGNHTRLKRSEVTALINCEGLRLEGFYNIEFPCCRVSCSFNLYWFMRELINSDYICRSERTLPRGKPANYSHTI